MDERRVRDLMEHDCRTRLAETCGTRDKSPSSNLGRGKQGDAIRADIMSPQVDDRGPAPDVQSPQASQRTSTVSDDVEQESEWDMTVVLRPWSATGASSTNRVKRRRL